MNPLRSWHRLDGSVKLAVYTRLSIEFIIVSFGLYLVILGGVMLHRAGHVVWQVVAGIAVAVLFTVVGVLITELRPEFNIGQRRSLPRLLPFAAVVTALTWVVALVAYHSNHSATADAGLYLLLIVLTLPPVGVLPWLPWRWTIGVVAAGVTTWVAFPDLGWIPAFVALFLLITTVLSAWTVGVARQLNRARLTESALQVSEERLRFAQELHDTLGQRLAAISVKAELARAFVARGDARSDAELADLQALVRTSVNEMHEVVDGYRSVELSSEIDNARVLLESSGVRFDLDGDAASVKGSTRELAAWLVREATTNILRHSDATWVRISVEPGRVTVTNDGASRAIGRMSGLAGIQHRAHPAGARVTAAREGNLFTVTLTGGV